MLKITRARLWLLPGICLVALVGACWMFLKNPDNKAGPGSEPTLNPGFKEAAHESGIHFRMRFLPDEQGENFKINLYDHGCGVAVADFDGDGHEDVYFVNQLGKNALYRNNGDGTFTDV